MTKTERMPHVEVGPERMVMTDGIQPYLCSSSKGTIYLQGQLTPPLNYSYGKRNHASPTGNALSRDAGQTWERWIPKAWSKRQPMIEGAATELSDGALLMIEWIAVPASQRGTFAAVLWELHDDLQTVAGPIRATVKLPQARRRMFDDGGHPFEGICFHRSLLELSNGDLLATAYCSFEEDTGTCTYQPKMPRLRTVLLCSSNRGRHWEYVATIAADDLTGDEGFNEPVIVRLTNGICAGRFVCLMRIGGDEPIHQSVSDDDGMTWSKPRTLPFRGVDPDLLELPDGTLICSFGRRSKTWRKPRPSPASGPFVVLSNDGGTTWQQPVKIPIEPYSNTPWSTCYTALHLVGPNEVIVFYDVGRWNQPIRYISSRKLKIRESR
jgi:hypothetical protein